MTVMSTLRNVRALIHNETSVVVVTSCLEEARLMSSQFARIMPPKARHGESLTYGSLLWARFVPITGSPNSLEGCHAMMLFGPTPLLHVPFPEAQQWQRMAFQMNERLRTRGVDPN